MRTGEDRSPAHVILHYILYSSFYIPTVGDSEKYEKFILVLQVVEMSVDDVGERVRRGRNEGILSLILGNDLERKRWN